MAEESQPGLWRKRGKTRSHSGKGIPGWWCGANRTTTEPIQRTAARPPK